MRPPNNIQNHARLRVGLINVNALAIDASGNASSYLRRVVRLSIRPMRFFEVPILLPLPEDLNFIP